MRKEGMEPLCDGRTAHLHRAIRSVPTFPCCPQEILITALYAHAATFAAGVGWCTNRGRNVFTGWVTQMLSSNTAIVRPRLSST